ncbi:cation transport ATPase [Streptomyces sp. MJP52]|nr:cation transport ATPase [Streptomyces sp. MJP52]
MGPVVRRAVAVVLASVMFAEAAGVAWLNWFLAMMVEGQRMSLDGLDPDVVARSSRIGAVLFALFFVACGVLVLVSAVRGRAPGRFGTGLLVTVAVVHGLLGAAALALVGVEAFAVLAAVLVLVLLFLSTPGRPRDEGPGSGDDTGAGVPPAPPAGTAPATTG